MSDGTTIEWTDATWNPIRAMYPAPDGSFKLGWHCEHASEGCRNCYAEIFNRRLGTGFDYKPGHLIRPGPHYGDLPRGDVSVFLDEKALLKPLHWKRPRKIFPCSMTDLFARFVTDEMLDQVFAVMALTPQHTYQVLTKRPDRMRQWFHPTAIGRVWARAMQLSAGFPKLREPFVEAVMPWPLPNVWLGVSVEDQPNHDERAPALRETPAAIRWLSMEPLLGPVDVDLTGIDWVVAGGESGPKARKMHPDWVVSIQQQCEAAGVPFLFKQWRLCP